MPHRPIDDILAKTHPYDALPLEARMELAKVISVKEAPEKTIIYEIGTPVQHLCVITEGQVQIRDEEGEVLCLLGIGNTFGERGLMRDGLAPVEAYAVQNTKYLSIPASAFYELIDSHPVAHRFFDRTRAANVKRPDITTMAVEDLMSRGPLTCAPDSSLIAAAREMRDRYESCMIVTRDATTNGQLEGIMTSRDMTARAVAEGLDLSTPVREIMTPNPFTCEPDDMVADVLNEMFERNITHMPVVKADRLIGVLTQTDLTRFHATSSTTLVRDIALAKDAAEIAHVTDRIPDLLVQLVGSQNPHQVVTRLITDVGDAATRRLLALAEAKLGPPPVPYLWLACGSQGRQEQTGVSDQDNCLIIHDDMTPDDDAYFAQLAKFVSDGLDEAGYFYCPGDMMATNPKWRQPLRVWRDYFDGWIAKPDPEAQMLASVMFDLRPIGGDSSLFEGLHVETLEAAENNSIFVSHMVSNSLKHTPPLSIFRGFTMARSGEHKNTLDLKHSGVVPIVDLGRIYALTGKLEDANTRARIVTGIEAGVISETGGRDLLDAYDLIAELRLAHQAAQIQRGEKPDNFMLPSSISDFERSHLRDAFIVVKTMQSAAGSSRSYLN